MIKAFKKIERHKFVSRDGLSLSVELAGLGGQRLVVLSHGGGQTRHSWNATARSLAEMGYLVLSFDLRGHGDSGWAEDGAYALTDFAGDLAALIRHYQPSSMIGPALVGASLGGLTSLLVAGRPEIAAAALVMVDVSPTVAESGVERIVSFMSANPEGFADLDEAADAVAAYRQQRSRPADHSGLAKNLRLNPDTGRLHWHWDPRMLSDVRRPDRIDAWSIVADTARTLEMPVLLVRGARSDVVTDVELSQFRALVPHLEFADISGAGHMVVGDRQDHFSRMILDFLKVNAPA